MRDSLAQQIVAQPATTSAPIVFDAIEPFSGSPPPREPRTVDDFSAVDALGAAVFPHACDEANAARAPDKFDFDVVDSRALSLTVMGRVIEENGVSRRPDDSALVNVEGNERRYHGDVRLAAMDDRVQLSGSYNSPVRVDDPLFDRVDYVMGTGGAGVSPTLRQRLDVQLVNSGGLRIASYGQYAQYGALAGAADAFVGGDRSRSEFGVDLALDPLKLGVSVTSSASGAEYLRTALTTRETIQTMRADLAFSTLFREIGPLPARIGVSHRVTHVTPFEFEEHNDIKSSDGIESRRSTTDAFSPSWDWRFGTTGLSLSQTSFRSSLEDDPTGAGQGRNVDLKQSARFGAVTASANVGYAEVDHSEPAIVAEQRYRSGAEFRVRLAGLPEFNARGEVTFSRAAAAVAEPYATRSWRMTTSVDFSRALPTPLVDRGATLRLSGIVRGNGAQGPDGGADTVDGALTLMGKIVF